MSFFGITSSCLFHLLIHQIFIEHLLLVYAGTVLEAEDVADPAPKAFHSVCVCTHAYMHSHARGDTFINAIISQVNVQLPTGQVPQRESTRDPRLNRRHTSLGRDGCGQ